jgi:hypothetical protein
LHQFSHLVVGEFLSVLHSKYSSTSVASRSLAFLPLLKIGYLVAGYLGS